MSLLRCYQIRSLIASGELSEASRLKVELHRDECARCRTDVLFDEGLGQLAAEVEVPPNSAMIERAISGAFDREPVPPPQRFPIKIAAGLTAVAAAAVVALVWVVTGGQAQPSESQTASVPQADAGLAPAKASTDLEVGQTLELAHASVTATRDSRFSWDAASGRISLARGSLEIEVTPGTGRSLSVATDDFIVEVVGTLFAVDLDRVVVKRGAVRVIGRDGNVIRERLSAGQSWRTNAEQPEPVKPTETPVDEPAETAASLLKRAAKQLRAQKLSAARRSVKRALNAEPSRRERAEAHTLSAEIALVSGDVAGAIFKYRRVAKRYQRYSQGESALFAAARLEARRGKRQAARALLLEYRQRYPKGRFAREVERKLEELGR